MENRSVPISTAVEVQSICVLGIALSYWISHVFFESTFVSDPVRTLGLFLIVEGPLLIALYSFLRDDPQKCSYWKAVGRGLLGLPLGALINAFGAIVLGAPLGLMYWKKTINWSLLMSLFTFVPATCVFGWSSKENWQRLVQYSKMTGRLDYMLSFPAYGAIVGGWFGAFPMPLDWERAWQEWPICVTYGVIAGYFLGILISLVLPVARKSSIKID
ncbi:hypothetical protein ZOSMA_123G00380 [Zostera marina]|uniref:Phosphatidylinositol-glycan biosynthesis class F protein n=1 Tax=Zostera marina TaxID=29655 RepID=A0A0K9Q2M9_ZOSMR|nr:hypothetical protein ZOSMA_123G00380 [Zostera marina]